MIHMAPGTQRKFNIPYQRLDDVLTYQSSQRPHDPAILAPGRPFLSYRRLRQHLADLARQLQYMGLERHDRIAVVLPPSAEMAVAFLSVALRATCAPLNPNYSEQEFAFYLKRLRATALIVQAGQSTPARTVALAQGLSIIELTPLSQEAAGLFTLSPVSLQHPRLNGSGDMAQPDDVALVLHTSGTTSTPKVIPLTHSQICAGAYQTGTALGLTSSDCCLNIVPLFHTYGLVATTLASLVVGACVAVPGAFEVDHFFAWIDRFQPTWYPGVPAMHRAILRQSEAYRDVVDRCVLRFIRSAAAPLPQHILEQLEDVFHVPVIEVYSLSETSLITCNPPLQGPRKAGSVGQPPRVGAASDVSIINETGTPLPIGHVGEIVVKGPSVITAYDGDAEINRTAFTDGWFHTGDQGYLDQDGYLYLTGRIKDLINRGGEKIAPQEVDNVLMAYAAVAEAATFAVPHIHLIEDIAAAVVLHPNASATPSELRQFAAERLAAFKVPLQIFIVDHIPKHPVSGKLQRHQLAEQLDLRSHLEQDVAPRTPEEKALTELWAQVLHVDQVHVHDNFSQLGGDSITATQLLSRIRDVMHVDISFRSFFEEPTVAGMARRLNRSHQITSEVIALEGGGENQGLLSFAQQRLWFLDQWLPHHAVYNQLHAWRVTGRLQVAALEQSLAAICRRHEMLRTSFVSQDGQPVQVVHPVPSQLLVEIDLKAMSEAHQAYDVQQRIKAEVQRRFDLARDPLWFVYLLQLANESYVLLLNIHHIIIDGWSFEVFFRELNTLYESYASDKVPNLPPLPLQYRDFSLWQRQWFQGEVLKQQLAYWQHKLSKNLPLLTLPTDRPRLSIQTFQGRCQSRVLPQRLTPALHALSQHEGSTLFMTLLAAFKVLLHRYSGQNDLVVGMPIAGRTQLDLENLIGFFVNTLVLRTDVGGNPPFLELLARVRRTALEAYDHQDLPFEKLVEELSTNRNTSHTPLFQVIFALQNASQSDLAFADLTVERLAVENETAKFDLALAIKDTEQGLHVEAEYATDLFDDATIVRMLGHYQTLLEHIVDDPQQCIATLPLLSEVERRQVLIAGCGTTADNVPLLCLHQLFQTQAEQTPNAIAVIHDVQYLTYHDLNQQADQLARALRRLGVGPESCVGLCIERSLDMIVGILGILKAGGAYVPLDPSHPKDRLSFMIKESGVTIVVTHQQFLSQLPRPEVDVIRLDTNLEQFTTQQVAYDIATDDVIPSNLAYVMYTSGSTGEPKGVMVEHRQIVGLLYAFEHLAPAQGPRIGSTACAMSFDVSVWEMFSMLCFGGTLHILTHDSVADPQRFARYITDHGITSTYIPPALLPGVASHFEQAAAMPLQRLLVGVEPIKQQTLQRFRDLSDTLSIVNGYGPTETTICATFFSFDRALEPGRRTPIGTAIHGGEIYLVDAHLQPVPMGIPGELLVGGIGLTRGYINRPELTAARFIPHPFRETSGARLYRTGDQARRLSDGHLEFLGRLDQQVKIRGYRIEPGEIEAALTNLPEVEATAVIAREVQTDDYRLVAYVVPARQPDRTSTCEPEHDILALDLADPLVPYLRQQLRAQLPAYMMPSAFVILDALPMSPNGKVDRQALSERDIRRAPTTAAFVEPRTDLEIALAKIWTDVLGLSPVSIHDNFFELGGDSILSIQIVAQANRAGLRLMPRLLFQYQTIAELAAAANVAVNASPALEATPQGLITGAVPLTPIQHWFFAQDFAAPQHWNQSRLLEVQQPLDSALLKRAVHQVLSHHDLLRARFRFSPSGWQQDIVSAESNRVCEDVDLSALPAGQQDMIMHARFEQLQASLNLEVGPLVRIVVFDLGPQRHTRLFIVVHHLVVDGVSWPILLDDLQTAYGHLHSGREVRLPLKTTSFQYWAERLSLYAQADALRDELTYWMTLPQERFRALPRDHAPGENTVASAHIVSVSLSREDTHALLHEVPKAYQTQINDALLTALAQVVVSWTGFPALWFDLEGHGREDIFDGVDLSRTVGWFTSLFPVCLQMEPTVHTGDALKGVKEQLRGIPNRGIGYGILRYLCQHRGAIDNLRTLPQSEISFNYLGRIDREVSSWFNLTEVPRGHPRPPRSQRPYVLEINSYLAKGQLHVDWTYSRALHQPATIATLAHDFIEALRTLIVHCSSPDTGGYTPSDFPHLAVNQDELDTLLQSLDASEKGD